MLMQILEHMQQQTCLTFFIICGKFIKGWGQLLVTQFSAGTRVRISWTPRSFILQNLHNVEHQFFENLSLNEWWHLLDTNVNYLSSERKGNEVIYNLKKWALHARYCVTRIPPYGKVNTVLKIKTKKRMNGEIKGANRIKHN